MQRIIEGEHILLREIELDDKEILSKIVQEPHIKDQLGEIKKLSVKENLLQEENIIATRKQFRRVIIVKETKEIIGSVTIKEISKKDKRANIGYRIKESHKGKGLMKECLTILTTHLFKEEGLNRIQARVKTDNIASYKLLEKIGFVYEGLAKSYAIKNGICSDFFLYGLVKKENNI